MSSELWRCSEHAPQSRRLLPPPSPPPPSAAGAPATRVAALRAAGAEVVVGDLLEPAAVYRIVSGCRRVYFGMSVSAGYLEGTVTMAAVARELGVNALVNMSRMTISQMNIQNSTPSPQQPQHWLSANVCLIHQ
ncbi:MAG TPA: NAD(P)H-binding protein [Terrimicrobiaceae bacterium]